MLSVILAACNSSSPQGPRPDAGTEPPPDASGGDAASEPDAATAVLGRNAIVFAATLDGQFASDLYVLDGSVTTRLTFTGAAELYPSISPDRTRIAFVRDFQLFSIGASGGRELLVAPRTGRERTINGTLVYSTTLGPAAWSPDGTQLAYPYPREPHFVEIGPDLVDESGGTTIHIIDADGTDDRVVPNLGESLAPTLNSIGWGPDDTLSFSAADDCPECAGGGWFAVIHTDGSDYRQISFDPETGRTAPNKHLDWSPDGTRWVYVAGGDHSVYERPGFLFTSPAYVADEREVAPGEAWNPRWSPDGTEIAYIAADGIYVVAAGGGMPRRVLAVTEIRGLDW